MPRREAAGGSLVLRASGVLIVMKLALMYKAFYALAMMPLNWLQNNSLSK